MPAYAEPDDVAAPPAALPAGDAEPICQPAQVQQRAPVVAEQPVAPPATVTPDGWTADFICVRCKTQNWYWMEYCRACRKAEVSWHYYPE